MEINVNVQQIKNFMKSIKDDEVGVLASKLIAIKCAFWIKNADLKELDEKTRNFAVESCKAALDSDEKKGEK